MWIHFWASRKIHSVYVGNTLYTLRGHSFLIKIADLSTIFEINIFKEYQVCPLYPKDLVIDIGAYIGGFTCMAAKVAHRGKVIAIEPFPESFEMLRKNTRHLPNVTALNIAVSSKEGPATLYINQTNPADNSLYRRSFNQKIRVHTEILQGIFKKYHIKYCNVLKMDCEGTEYNILLSSAKTLKKVERIIMEYYEPKYFLSKDTYTSQNLIQFLKKNGLLSRW